MNMVRFDFFGRALSLSRLKGNILNTGTFSPYNANSYDVCLNKIQADGEP